MAAGGAGRGAWRVEQNRVSGLLGPPISHIGGDDFSLKLEAAKIFAQAVEALGGVIDGGHIRSGRCQLRRLAAGRGAEVDDRAAAHVAEQAHGQGRTCVLNPPGAFSIARQIFDAATGDSAQRAGRQRFGAERRGPLRRHCAVA